MNWKDWSRAWKPRPTTAVRPLLLTRSTKYRELSITGSTTRLDVYGHSAKGFAEAPTMRPAMAMAMAIAMTTQSGQRARVRGGVREAACRGGAG